jgi:hypothetical protein
LDAQQKLAGQLGFKNVDEMEAAIDSMQGIADDGGQIEFDNIAREARIRSAYIEWCKSFGKESDESRFKVFSDNFLIMEKFAAESGKEMTLNQFADCTEAEYKAATAADAKKEMEARKAQEEEARKEADAKRAAEQEKISKAKAAEAAAVKAAKEKAGKELEAKRAAAASKFHSLRLSCFTLFLRMLSFQFVPFAKNNGQCRTRNARSRQRKNEKNVRRPRKRQRRSSSRRQKQPRLLP